jgi:predicted negative regulator of RcsB-dependent stress response
VIYIKKAQIKSELGKIIIAVIILILILMFAWKLYEYFSKNDRQICRTSVLAEAVVMQTPGGKNLIQPDCKTYNVVFFDNHVEIN